MPEVLEEVHRHKIYTPYRMSYLELIAKVGGGDRITMSKSEFKKEHKRLLKALKTRDPKLLMEELHRQQSEVKEVLGGRAGVTKASGFIQRLMAENKLKHTGQYKKPTYPLASNSTMSQPAEFEWKKLASPEQGGLNNRKPYGASPFIMTHFSRGDVPYPARGQYGRETQAQRVARYRQMATRLETLARRLAGQPPQAQAVAERLTPADTAPPPPPQAPPLQHFGNVMEGLEIRPIAREAPPTNQDFARVVETLEPPAEEEEEEEEVQWSIPEGKLDLYDWEDMTKQEADKWRKKKLIADYLGTQAWRMSEVKPREVAEYLSKHGWKTGLDSSALSKGIKDVIEDVEESREYEKLYNKYGPEARTEQKYIKEKFGKILAHPSAQESKQLRTLEKFFKAKATKKRRDEGREKYYKNLNQLRDLAKAWVERQVKELRKRIEAEGRQVFSIIKGDYKIFLKIAEDNLKDRDSSAYRYRYSTTPAELARDYINAYLVECVREKTHKEIDRVREEFVEKLPDEALSYEWDEGIVNLYEDVKRPESDFKDLDKSNYKDVDDDIAVAYSNAMIHTSWDDADFINCLDKDWKEQIEKEVAKNRKSRGEYTQEKEEEETATKGMTWEQKSQWRTCRAFRKEDFEIPSWWAKITALRNYVIATTSKPEDYMSGRIDLDVMKIWKKVLENPREGKWEGFRLRMLVGGVFMEKLSFHKEDLESASAKKALSEAEDNYETLQGELDAFLESLRKHHYYNLNEEVYNGRRIMWIGDLNPVWAEWDAEMRGKYRLDVGQYPCKDWNKSPSKLPIELEEVEEAEEVVIPARPPPKVVKTGATIQVSKAELDAKSKKKTREERLLEIAEELPHKAYVDWSEMLKKEGYTGVSPANLSNIINKTLKPQGKWKLADWAKARAEKQKRGGGMLDDTKRVINSKTPWTLSHLPKEQLKSLQASPEVPPSMKEKLGMAIDLVGSGYRLEQRGI